MQLTPNSTPHINSTPSTFLYESTYENFKATLIYIGEGLNGDFKENSQDVPLLRLEVFELKDKHWELIEDGSICTQLSLNDQTEHLQIFIDKIAKNITLISSKSPLESTRNYLEEVCFNPFSLIQN